MRSLTPRGRGDLGVKLRSVNLHLPTYDSQGGSTDQRFRLLPNYFGHLLLLLSSSLSSSSSASSGLFYYFILTYTLFLLEAYHFKFYGIVEIKSVEVLNNLADNNLYNKLNKVSKLSCAWNAVKSSCLILLREMVSLFMMRMLDVDECELGGNACTQGCRNLKGSYVCTCSPGYQLGTDGKSCYRMSLHTLIFLAFAR